MRRFNFEDDDQDNERDVDPNEYIIGPEEYNEILESEINLYERKFKNSQQQMNYKLLLTSLKMLKTSFWWNFYSLNTKLNYIQKTCTKLKELVQVEDEEQ